MRRNVWSVEELAQILSATNEANTNADYYLASGTLNEENTALMQAYRQGFKAALGSIARAVGAPANCLLEMDERASQEISAHLRRSTLLSASR